MARGSEEQKRQLRAADAVEGRFFGTMCLSEPQAGSSLADIKTRAEPQRRRQLPPVRQQDVDLRPASTSCPRTSSTWCWRKIPGAPPGVKGISLFIVPKYLVNADGSLGERNDVALAGLNHKMGYRGTVNTLLNFGEGK